MREESKSALQNDLICVCTTGALPERNYRTVLYQQPLTSLVICVKFTRYDDYEVLIDHNIKMIYHKEECGCEERVNSVRSK